LKSVIRPLARQDILRQYHYLFIEEKVPEIAARFLLAVQSSIEQVSKRAGIGVPVDLENPKLAGPRSWRVNGFPAIRIYYLVSQKTLRVIRVLHGKRDIHPLLEMPDEPR
jgi:plasmid stabilization system protein ParE